MNSKASQIVFGMTFLVIGLGLFTYSLAEDPHTVEVGALFFPRILLGGWILVSCLIVAKAFFTGHLEKIETISWSKFLQASGIVLLFLVAFIYLGFFVSGILFFFFYSVYLGYKKYFVLLFFSLFLISVTWYVFYNILEIVLPGFLDKF